MSPLKISLLGMFMFAVFFMLLTAFYDIFRCVAHPEMYFHSVISTYTPGSHKWYLDLLRPDFIMIAFMIPKLIIMKKFASASEHGSVWNPIFYFAFAVVIAAGTLTVYEIFDTPDLEIIQNA